MERRLLSNIRYNAFMDQNSNAARLLFNTKTISAIEELVVGGKLPDGHATVLYLKMFHAIFAPMDDPDFELPTSADDAQVGARPFHGPPCDCILSQWTGLYILRYWRTFIKEAAPLDLTLGDNFCSLELYNTAELTVHGCTNYILDCKRHKPPEIEWRLAAPCRNVATTTDMEGTFGGIRMGKIGHHNSVNCTFKVSAGCWLCFDWALCSYEHFADGAGFHGHALQGCRIAVC